MKLNKNDQNLINSILENVRDYRIKNNWNQNEIILISFDFLFKKILKNKEKIEICEKFLLINPLKYGFNGNIFEKYDLKNFKIFKKIRNQKLKNNTKISTQYLPKDVFRSFKKMNYFIKKELGSDLIIQSGYRSPSYQLIVFFWNLRDSNYDFDSIVKKVALPFYSEHGSLNNQAIDFVNYDANNLFESIKFKNTKEYKWLKENAEFFGFYESYSKNNSLGVIYEPWHWHYKK